eukprot:TRINITY_DN121741_c0_g1_i1.p3 TRINITY_DN121741_c0_g1~~TRINITY_DN121741_c0_g1_i1.p3  ORF type:complete len:221 (+),score=20.68 TRINITY_DN121741_c0_g1_i1:783-1445(+)
MYFYGLVYSEQGGTVNDKKSIALAITHLISREDKKNKILLTSASNMGVDGIARILMDTGHDVYFICKAQSQIIRVYAKAREKCPDNLEKIALHNVVKKLSNKIPSEFVFDFYNTLQRMIGNQQLRKAISNEWKKTVKKDMVSLQEILGKALKSSQKNQPKELLNKILSKSLLEAAGVCFKKNRVGLHENDLKTFPKEVKLQDLEAVYSKILRELLNGLKL